MVSDCLGGFDNCVLPCGLDFFVLAFQAGRQQTQYDGNASHNQVSGLKALASSAHRGGDCSHHRPADKLARGREDTDNSLGCRPIFVGGFI